MHLTEKLLGFMLLGSEWVLWLLLCLSIVSVTVMVERAIFLRVRSNVDALAREVGSLLFDPEDPFRLLAGTSGAGLVEYRFAIP